MKVLGVDIGGTFTDFVLLDAAEKGIRTGKMLTDPAKPDRVVLEGISRLLEESEVPAETLAYVVHGTTLVTNAIIERKGSLTYLITTKGFRDALEIRREKRYDIYNLDIRFPDPLIPRHRRLEIDERTAADGSVLRAPQRKDVLELLARIPPGEKPAFAISFLHAYRNPENEQLVAGWIREELGEEISISLSSAVAPEIREYERTSTTAINAYVQPLVAGYLDRLESSLHDLGIESPPMIMLSHGGLARFRLGKQHPVRILESGPAGGASVAAYIAKGLDLRRALAFDMGGTTAKICLIDDFIPRVVADGEVARVDRFKRGSGLPVMVPMVDLIEIGAGGGSIASRNAMGLLAVGPQSAGADPGPACYGRGGMLPTVSDANLVLGYLDPENFLGGKMKLDRDSAVAAFGPLTQALAKPAEEVAWAVHATVNQNMVRAAQMHAFDCARALAEYTMFCFGGAAPAHACRVAFELGIRRVVIPVAAGVASALGFLVAPASMDLRRTALVALSKAEIGNILDEYGAMATEALESLRDVGVTRDNAEASYAFEGRFVGQAHALTVELGTQSEAITLDRIGEAFRQKYSETYGDHPTRSDIEITALLLRMQGPPPIAELAARPDKAVEDVESGRRKAFFPELGGLADTTVSDRDRLAIGQKVSGPAILQERETTIVLSPGAVAEVDRFGNVVIDLSGMSLS